MSNRFRIFFARGNWDSHLAILAGFGFHAAIIGPRGSGKTTLLEQLATRLARSLPNPILYQCIPNSAEDHSDRVGQLVDKKRRGTILLVDGMERLSRPIRNHLLKSRWEPYGGLILTSHRRCRLPTWIRCRASEAVLRHVLEQLPLQVTSTLWREANQKLQSNRGNVRDVLRYLYDQFADGRYTGPFNRCPAGLRAVPPCSPSQLRSARTPSA